MFSNCVWWFLSGVVIGALLCWLACRCLNCKRMKRNAETHTASTTTSALLSSAPSDSQISAVKAKKSSVKKTVVKPKVKANSPKTYLLDTVAAKAAGFTLKGPNDLTVIEGIGPKISELFNNAGVSSFAKLAKQTMPQMQKILDDGGASYRIANPATWTQQASLAAENKWAELKELQDSLSGGV